MGKKKTQQPKKIKNRDVVTEKMLVHTKPGPHIKNTNKQKRKKAKQELKKNNADL
jgi:hypothetical protein